MTPAVTPDARRRRLVEAQLALHPEQRHAFHAVGVSPAGIAAEPVSIVYGTRTERHGVVVGELTIPGDRWDMCAFLACLDGEGAAGRPVRD